MKYIIGGLKHMKNLISFTARNSDVEACVDRPVPAREAMPDWFKNMPNTNIDGARTAKACMPFLDTFTSGYTQTLWCDIEVSDNGKKIEFDSPFRPFSTTEGIKWHDNLFPSFDGYYDTETHWLTQWEPVTPKGYSTIFFHPLNRFDLPFVSLSGIMETDKFNTPGTFPFLIKKGFQGIIPKHTPIYQMIPFKRENWGIGEYRFNKIERMKQTNNIRKEKIGGYKKHYWEKKIFE